MNRFISLFAISAASLVLLLASAGLVLPQAQKPGVVDYARDIKPLLMARCYACHGNGNKLGGLQLDTREAILTGGQTHPVVRPGKSGESYLIKLVTGQVPGKIMPARGPRLTAAEIALLKAWIDQGLPFGRASVESLWKPYLAPREVRLPAPKPGSDQPHPIDLLLQRYFDSHGTPRAASSIDGPLVDDRTYARRVYLDIIGMLPTPEQLHAFLDDPRTNKRTILARVLLADNQRYAEHWLTFWNDMLRNDYAGTGYIDGGRKQITGWLYDALFTNMPYDRFVASLVNPTPESAGFINGIVWRGVVNASQTPEMQAAQNISQLFMGANLKCASCHDSFINNWKLADSYGMASIYAEKPLEMVRCDKPTGKIAPVKFMYPELGVIDGAALREKRLEQLAAVLTGKANGRLARTMVNRLWTRLMGRGLVEPNDEMDNRPWFPDLLDWLAWDFGENGFNVKHTIERIVTSRAYQLPAMGLKSERAEGFVFRGPAVKRMSAEQLLDAVSMLTGVWQRPASQFAISKGKPILPTTGSAKILFQSGLMKSGSVDIDVDVSSAQVLFLVVTDGGNGANFDWADWAEPRFVGPSGEIKLTDLKWRYATTGYGQVRINQSVVEKPIRLADRVFNNGIGTHANSVIAYVLPEGVTRFRATAGPDTGGIESPGSETSIELYVVTGDLSLLETRAALANADPLMRALGRPNREQVVTQRATAATTLQAIELTNGGTLAASLRQGAEKWAKESDPEKLIESLYEQALSRPPTPAERRIALQLVGAPPRKEGVEDLLWALVMLPEFQLVY